MNSNSAAAAPLVTVITVTYNSANYVRDAIESVLYQNYSNIEYIIGDDCSTDGTWDIIEEYQDERIKAYRNPSNMREYPNRNKALSMASGKYVLFIDGDDMVLAHGLAYMVTMLEAFPDAAMAIVGYDCNHFIYPLEFTPAEIYKFQFFGRGFLGYSMVGNLFRTLALKEQHGFPTNLISGDYYMRLKICLRHKCLIIGGNPVWARSTPGQASSNVGTLRGYTELLLMNRDIIQEPLCPLNERDRKQALANVLRPAARRIVKDLLGFHWKRSIALARALGWGWRDIKKYFGAAQDHSYMSEFNSTTLLKMDLARNPFSTSYKKEPF